MTNPFSLSFGKEPLSFIERGRQSREIIDGFSEKNPSCHTESNTSMGLSTRKLRWKSPIAYNDITFYLIIKGVES